jgi:hypothetical protein
MSEATCKFSSALLIPLNLSLQVCFNEIHKEHQNKLLDRYGVLP